MTKKVDVSCLQFLNTQFTHPSSEASMQLTGKAPSSWAFTMFQELAEHVFLQLVGKLDCSARLEGSMGS